MPHVVYYNLTYSSNILTECKIKDECTMKCFLASDAIPTDVLTELPIHKIEALKFMLKWMPLTDQEFYKAFITQLKLKIKSVTCFAPLRCVLEL